MDSRKPTNEQQYISLSDADNVEALVNSARQELRQAYIIADSTRMGFLWALILATGAATAGIMLFILAITPHLVASELVSAQLSFIAPCAAVLLIFVGSRELSLLFLLRSERDGLLQSAKNCEDAIKWAIVELDEQHYVRPD